MRIDKGKVGKPSERNRKHPTEWSPIPRSLFQNSCRQCFKILSWAKWIAQRVGLVWGVPLKGMGSVFTVKCWGARRKAESCCKLFWRCLLQRAVLEKLCCKYYVKFCSGRVQRRISHPVHSAGCTCPHMH